MKPKVIWSRWKHTITLGVILLIVLPLAVWSTFAAINIDKQEWRDTCDRLNAEFWEGPANDYTCVRDGEVVYPR